MSQVKFESDFFLGNRRRLQAAINKDALIVLTGNGMLQRSGDTTFPFRQDSNFWYLTGIDDPDIVLVIDGNDEYLIVPTREAIREAFDGAINFDKLSQISGIKEVTDAAAGWTKLSKRLQKAGAVATLSAPPGYVEEMGMYTNPARARLITMLQERNSKLEVMDIREHFFKLRQVKQPIEIAAIQQAIDVTIETLSEATDPRKLAAYAHEYELAASITHGFLSRGANGHAYEAIVAGGKNACTLHYIENSAALRPGELLLMDVGSEFHHYAADITHTIATDEPTDRQRAVYDAVLDVQKFAMSLLHPGALLKDNEKQIEQFMGEQLQQLGLIDRIDSDAVRRYYPHSTSHFLGLDVHDVGDYEQPLPAGTVLTVEPGIYIPEEGIGVRIEDDVLITDDGIQVLSEALPRALA